MEVVPMQMDNGEAVESERSKLQGSKRKRERRKKCETEPRRKKEFICKKRKKDGRDYGQQDSTHGLESKRTEVEDSTEVKATSKEGPAVYDLLGVPEETAEHIWVDNLSAKEKVGCWALLLVSRRVCSNWRKALEGLWFDSIKDMKSFSFPSAVARAGWVELLSWAIEQGWSGRNSKAVMNAAAEAGQIRVMEWLGCHLTTRSTINAAMNGDSWEALQWCLEQQTKRWKSVAFHDAALYGKLGMLKLLAEEFPVSQKDLKDVMYHTACGGQIEIAAWLHDECGIELTERVAKYAARNGHLPFLQWLHAKGFMLNSDVVEEALKGSHLDAAQWMYREAHTSLRYCVYRLLNSLEANQQK